MKTWLFSLRYYLRRLLPFIIAGFVLELLELTVLTVREWANLSPSPETLIAAPVWVGTTLLSTLYSLIFFMVYLLILPRRAHGGRWDRRLTCLFFFAYVGLNMFEEVSELFFWDEFTSRFNFVAVDYLVYTQEVIGNIMQSYPVIPMLAGMFVISLLAAWALRRKLAPVMEAPRAGGRALASVTLICCACLLNLPDYMALSEKSGNRYTSELSRDGLYSLFHAFFANELSYRDFYPTLPPQDVETRLSALQTGKESLSAGPERRANVVVVLMESMGSEFFSEFRNDGLKLTPELEKLAAQSLYFSHTYAAGTRSVRGIEALTLSLPPLPGMALVRRPGNEHLYTLGSVFRERGYETKWIYGGFGYFDNMNAFFEGNGFSVVDRKSFADDEISFANIWGVCDEDLFRKVVREADASYAAGRPFMDVVLTTSNHRPYTFPEGRISLPSKEAGRKGGVMYADYAVGRFMEEARTKPWFDDTVFVFVADHGAGSAGREELNFENHHIPLIIYAPGWITPRRVDTPISQIDAAPTLLALLNLPHGRFMGSDALAEGYVSRLVLGNYQKIAYARGNETVIMGPVRHVRFYRDGKLIGEGLADGPEREAPAPDAALRDVLEEGIALYQHADDWQNFLREK